MNYTGHAHRLGLVVLHDILRQLAAPSMRLRAHAGVSKYICGRNKNTFSLRCFLHHIQTHFSSWLVLLAITPHNTAFLAKSILRFVCTFDNGPSAHYREIEYKTTKTLCRK